MRAESKVFGGIARSSRQLRLGVVVVEGAFGEEGARERVETRDLGSMKSSRAVELTVQKSSNP